MPMSSESKPDDLIRNIWIDDLYHQGLQNKIFLAMVYK